MRSDLAKLTTERERRGGGREWTIKYGGRVPIEDRDETYDNEHGGFHSSARHRIQNHKDFSDVLRPLRGAIRANVGRPWDDVYSEFCRVLDRRGLSGYHIWTHLMQEVTINTFMGEDGGVMEHGNYFGPQEVDGFYVHPATGILCYKERDRSWKRRWREERMYGDLRKGILRMGDRSWQRDKRGLWFEYRWEQREVWEFKAFGQWRQQQFTDDASAAKLSGASYYEGNWGKWETKIKEMPVTKRSLCRREIRDAKAEIAKRIKNLNHGFHGFTRIGDKK